MNAGGILAEGPAAPLSAGPWAEIPSVDWWMTSHCNLACDFCYGPAPGKDPVERRAGILEALAASSARVVTFCGGEPLLVRKIDQYAATLARCGKSTVLNTNGQLLRTRLDQGFGLADFAMVGGRRVPAAGHDGHGTGRTSADGAVYRSRDGRLLHRRPGRERSSASRRRVHLPRELPRETAGRHLGGKPGTVNDHQQQALALLSSAN